MSTAIGKGAFAGLALVAALALPTVGAPEHEATAVPQIIDNGTRIDVNQAEMVVTNHGSFAYDLIEGNSGLFFPRGTTNTVVFASGLWIGAKVGDEEAARVTVGEYSQEYSPGNINPDGSYPDAGDPDMRMYKINWNDPDHELSEDYLNWPSDLGAPVDQDGNPQRLGDQTLWSVFHDANPADHSNDAGNSIPLGVEVQQTTFAFDRQGGLGNTIFTKFLIINRSDATLDSAYVSVWSDPDLGGAGDDLVGCDVDLSLGYCYNVSNNDQLYGSRPPAVGYDFFQGPIVAGAETDTAYVSGVPVPGFKNLPMTSFNKYTNGTDPHTPGETYNYMQGRNADGTPVTDPDGNVTFFQNPGDPVAGTGWLDSNAADRRYMLSAGPFTMAPGESQEVVVGIVVAQGPNRLGSVSLLKIYDAEAQSAYDVNFDLPKPPPRPVTHARPYDGAVDLYWEPYAEDVPTEINERLGVLYEFEGYNVYQGASVGGPWTKIATFDRDSQFSSIYADVVNEDAGVIERQLVQTGNDNGLQWNIRVDQDVIGGGPLVNFKEYYFAVSAYSAEVNNVEVFETSNGTSLGLLTSVLENSQQPIPIMPKQSTATLDQTADHAAGISDGSVQVDYVNQDEIRADDYEVRIFENPTDDAAENPFLWRLDNLTTNTTLLDSMRNQASDYSNPITEGFIAQVVGPPLAVRQWTFDAVEDTGRWLSWVGAGLSSFNGGVGLGSEFFGSNLAPGDYSKTIEIRFVNDESAWSDCMTYRRDLGYVASGAGKWPGSAWDVTDPDNPRQVNICFVESESDVDPPKPANLQWDPNNSGNGGREYFFIMNSDYDGGASYGDGGDDPLPFGPDADVLLAGWTRLRGSHPYLESDAVWTFALNRINTAADVFKFTPKPLGSSAGSVIDNDLSKIRAVPNPYLNQSTYELNQFDRIMRFVNLPSKPCTVRIFNLAGELVRTLEKEDVDTSYLRWDLDNHAGIPVASGIYIYHVEAEGLGSNTGKVAIFIEKERLRNF